MTVGGEAGISGMTWTFCVLLLPFNSKDVSVQWGLRLLLDDNIPGLMSLLCKKVGVQLKTAWATLVIFSWGWLPWPLTRVTLRSFSLFWLCLGGHWQVLQEQPYNNLFWVMCLSGIIEDRDQPHFKGSTICLVEMQYKLLVCTISGPNRNSGFGPIGKGALEGLRLEI